MPFIEDNVFKFTWRVDDFSLWSGGTFCDVPWPSTPSYTIEALSNSEWQFELNPRTSDDHIACHFWKNRMYTGVDAEDFSVLYSVDFLGKNGWPYLRINNGILPKIKPGGQKHLNLILRDHISPVNDQFSFTFELRKRNACANNLYCRGKWIPELKSLSAAMRNLFETGIHSDLKLVTDDGFQITVHAFLLFARWPNLRNYFERSTYTNWIAIHEVSGSVLSAFVSYLYSGEMSGLDMTLEFFDFAMANSPHVRKTFHSNPTEVTLRTRQRKEHLTFTWHVGRTDSMPFCRLLPLHEVEDSAVLVELDSQRDEETGELCLTVTLHITGIPQLLTVHCTATLFRDDVRLMSRSEDHQFERGNPVWCFSGFIPMRLLASDQRPTRRRVVFELVLSDKPLKTYTEGCVTSFRTGFRAIRNIEYLATDLKEFFAGKHQSLYNLKLKLSGGCFLSCKAVLCARSETFRRFFRNPKKRSNTLDFKKTDCLALACVLEYVYTGWTNLTIGPLKEILKLAKGMLLHGLVTKCEEYLRYLELHTSTNELN